MSFSRRWRSSASRRPRPNPNPNPNPCPNPNPNPDPNPSPDPIPNPNPNQVNEQKHFLKEPMGSEAVKRFVNGFLRGGKAAAGARTRYNKDGSVNKDEV